MREAMGNRTGGIGKPGGRLSRAGAVTLLMLAGSLAAPTQAATILAELNYVVRSDLGELVAEYSGAFSEPDMFFEVGYQVAPFGSDYVASGGAAGDRYARAGTSAGIGTASGYGGLRLKGTGAGTWSEFGTAGGTGTADVTTLFRGAVGFDDPHTLSERNNFVCGEIPSCNIADQQFGFSILSSAFLALAVTGYDTNELWVLLANFQIRRDIVREGSEESGFFFFGSDSAKASWEAYYYPPDGYGTLIGSWSEERFFDPVIVGLRSFWEEMNLALPVTFVAGRLYQMELQVSCTSEALGITNFLVDRGPAYSFCQLNQSGYLTGFTDFRDAFGNPIAPFGLFARNGTNLALPSPFAPGGGGGGPAPIPEPATWAMLIAGFGLVGGTLRRRRLTAGVP